MDNRIWRIARRPEGTDFAAALELVEEDFAPLDDGQIRIRNTHLSMDAGTRMWLTSRHVSMVGVGLSVVGCWVVGTQLDARTHAQTHACTHARACKHTR